MKSFRFPETTISTDPKNRLFWLDVLRGIAVLLVVFHHVPQIPNFEHDRRSFFFVLYQFGWVGVDLFFVISGFLIGTILFTQLQEKGALKLPNFLARRAFRILPPYLFFLGVIFLHPNIQEAALSFLLTYLLFIQNYSIQAVHSFSLNSAFLYHLWSLSVEEHIYILLPLSIIGLKKLLRIEMFPWLVIVAITFSLAARIAHLQYGDFAFLFFTHCRLEGIATGSAIAYFVVFHPDKCKKLISHNKKILTLSLLFLLPAGSLSLHTSSFMKTAGITLNAMGFGGLVFLAIFRRPPSGTLSRAAAIPFAAIGLVSYSLYLWHPVVFQAPIIRTIALKLLFFIHAIGLTGNTFSIVVFLVAGILCALVSYYFIEKPLLKVRDKVISHT